MSGRKRATEKRYRKPFKKPVQTGTHYNTQGRRGIRPPETCKGLGSTCVLDKGHSGQCLNGDDDE